MEINPRNKESNELKDRQTNGRSQEVAHKAQQIVEHSVGSEEIGIGTLAGCHGKTRIQVLGLEVTSQPCQKRVGNTEKAENSTPKKGW